MTNISGTPPNINHLSQIKFSAIFTRNPNVEYFIQSVTLPGLSMGTDIYPNFLTNIPIPGDKVQYEQLTFAFIVDEDLRNWWELKQWMTAITFADDTDDYKELTENATALDPSKGTIYSNLSIFLYNHNQVANREITFNQVFPVSLSGVQFDATLTDESPALAQVALEFVNFTKKDL
ncbi:MAG: hypothetical protein ACOC2U_03365 [bacterium]